MNAGRNDPCPCGSGKKFKKCCLSKDREKRQEQFAARQRQLVAAAANREPDLPRPSFTPLPAPKAPPPAPPDPRTEAINARWEEFKEQDFDGRIELFRATLEVPELMDDEMAFGMLEKLYQGGIARGDRERFDGLVETLRERLPDVYTTSKKYYLGWQLVNALASRHWTARWRSRSLGPGTSARSKNRSDSFARPAMPRSSNIRASSRSTRSATTAASPTS